MSEGKSSLEVFKNLRSKNNLINSLVKLREIFPTLSLEEAKEIMIVSETDSKSLEDYQAKVFNDLSKEKNSFD